MNSKEKERYSRHILLRDMGNAGMEKIRHGRVAVIGAGGLASPLLTYLTVGGVGHITLIDHDSVSAPNLSRQFLFGKEDIGKPKVTIAAERLRSLNPDTEIEAITAKVEKGNFLQLTGSCDLVVETVDTTAAKLLIHDLALHHRKPLIHGAALGWEGQLLTVLPGETACLRCFFPDIGHAYTPQGLPWEDHRDSCSTEGVLSPLCGIIGGMQAAEVFRFFSQPRDKLHTGKMFRIDLSRNHSQYLHPRKACGCGALL